jgi:hypothetical protein
MRTAGLTLALLTVLGSIVACSGQGYYAAPQVPQNLNFTQSPDTTGGG